MNRFLITVLLTLSLVLPCAAQPTEQEIENYIIQKSISTGFVKPGFPVGVIQVESRLGSKKYRTGKHGRFYLPGGIHKDFKKKWNLEDWRVCCDVAIESLYKRMIAKNGNETAVLKKYNASYTYSYHNEIKKIKNNYNERNYYVLCSEKGNPEGKIIQVAQVGKRGN